MGCYFWIILFILNSSLLLQKQATIAIIRWLNKQFYIYSLVSVSAMKDV